MKRCAQMPNNGEYAVCGYAFDAPDTDGAEPFEFAEKGQRVTCNDCLSIMEELRATYSPSGKVKQ